jgi:fatty acid synthase
MSGIIKDTTEPIQHKLSNYKFKFLNEDNFEISKEDFYTEMKMRGFHCSEKFKNIIKASIKQTSALIKWNNNWITFIDSALQLYAFGNNLRLMQIPLFIQKLIIDNEEQEITVKNSKGTF